MIWHIAGAAGLTGSTNGVGTVARFNSPQGAATNNNASFALVVRTTLW
jgi:hypothetical protein